MSTAQYRVKSARLRSRRARERVVASGDDVQPVRDAAYLEGAAGTRSGRYYELQRAAAAAHLVPEEEQAREPGRVHERHVGEVDDEPADVSRLAVLGFARQLSGAEVVQVAVDHENHRLVIDPMTFQAQHPDASSCP